MFDIQNIPVIQKLPRNWTGRQRASIYFRSLSEMVAFIDIPLTLLFKDCTNCVLYMHGDIKVSKLLDSETDSKYVSNTIQRLGLSLKYPWHYFLRIEIIVYYSIS